MLEAIFLGIIQGLTEFIPVSSSGHLVLLPELLDWEERSTTFDVFLHGGTLLALLFHYRKYLYHLLKKSLHKNGNERNLIAGILIGSIPAGILGFVFKDFIDDNLKSTTIVALALIIVGLVFILTDYLPRPDKKTSKVSIKKAIIIGFFQPLAFIRGTSRSGITILGGLTQKLDLKSAVNFSFLLGIPIISAVFLYDLFDIISNGAGEENFSQLSVGFIASFIFGLIAIKFMLKFVTRTGLKWFGVYRLVLGLIIILLL